MFFRIDDDIDNIMTLDLKPKPVAVESVETFRDSGNKLEVTKENTVRADGTTDITDEIEDKVDNQAALAEQEEEEDTKHSTAEINSEKPETISKPEVSRKQENGKVIKTIDESEINLDDIVSEAEKVVHVNVPKRPKPAVRKKQISKGKPDVPKRPETTTTKPNVPKRPEVNPDKPNVPKKPEIIKEKPNVPKRPEVTKEELNVPKRPEVIKEKTAVPIRPKISARPKVADKQQSESEIDKHVSEGIENENDVLKYIQENTAVEEDIDLFS